MKLTNEMSKVIAELEFLIGSECYNPNSYDGWNEVEGCDFRYPINLPDNEGNYKKVRGNLNKCIYVNPEEITPSSVKFMKYKFGSNELYIGKGLLKAMDYLEQRYGLDFNELEASRKEEE